MWLNILLLARLNCSPRPRCPLLSVAFWWRISFLARSVLDDAVTVNVHPAILHVVVCVVVLGRWVDDVEGPGVDDCGVDD
jgi:hypothetical protein